MLIEYAMYCGVVAFVYAGILVQPSEALSFIPRFVQFMTSKEWIHKITFHCSKCIAGQIAFWSYPLLMWKSYHLFDHLLVVLFSIFFAAFIDKIYSRL